jgi:hypothetical protein
MASRSSPCRLRTAIRCTKSRCMRRDALAGKERPETSGRKPRSSGLEDWSGKPGSNRRPSARERASPRVHRWQRFARARRSRIRRWPEEDWPRGLVVVVSVGKVSRPRAAIVERLASDDPFVPGGDRLTQLLLQEREHSHFGQNASIRSSRSRSGFGRPRTRRLPAHPLPVYSGRVDRAR